MFVEMKRSGGTVVHGYEKQLEFYKAASQTEFGVFVIIDYGDLGNKLNEVNRIRDERVKNGERASEIIVIDTTRKASASKRK
ncbi:hypothetical protein [Bradyrhizobium zhanjiangense]|uniref:Uncharacterized protein n=1 Tax=Bradyrhizobium zhanjiangense TaxID=1325107 RepID=A0A4V1L4J1_9BRAD|nr:hypothetical protein [Bradyrhizobium zhanjiangense]RXH41654.1 hypothetical protein XH94_06600 [Bradyrhizobium zhanjiangense]